MRQESTVYFLGAGASADAGVPLTNILLRKIANRIRRRKGVLSTFIKAFGFLKADSSGRPPIVDVISLLDSCLRENRPLNASFTVDRLRQVRNELTVELSRVVESGRRGRLKVLMPEIARDQPGAKDLRISAYFREFARTLRPRNRGVGVTLQPGDAIITTNYDTNIDVALYELAYWEESGGRLGYSNVTDVFLGSYFRDPYNDEYALEDPTKVVDLFKLHGSLNWLYCPRCSRIYIAAFGFSVQYLTRKIRDELTCFCGFYSLEQVIIAPSVFQEIENPHLQAIWMNAYHVLESADSWTFVGYSFPTEDLAVRSLLYRAMSAMRYKRRKLPKIKVVCTRKDLKTSILKSRYESFFGRNIEFDGRGFSDYVLDP